MTIKEFREKVAESKHKDWFNSQTCKFKYQHLNEPIIKKGLSDIYEFFKRQQRLWENKPDDIHQWFKNVLPYYSNCVKRLENLVSGSHNWDQNQLNRQWGDLFKELQKVKINNEIYLVKGDAPEVDFLIDIHNDYPASFTSAYQYLIKRSIGNISGLDQLKGLILAYEFELQDVSELRQRRNNERKSLGHIRSEYENYISKAETSTTEYFKRTKENFDTHSEKIIEIKNEKEKVFDDWFGKSKGSFDTFHKESHDKIDELEKLYIEKLRFAAPVQYWVDRASDMTKDGKKWAIWFGVSIIIAAGSLFILLWIIPDEMTAALFSGEPAAIKWTLLFITFISFLAYGVRTFAKLTFSSFHLARDAEEREQLTHVYLALKKDGNVEKEDRQIILQSLFSRAETGLLKDDSSPTMPGTFLEKISGIK